MDFKYSIAIIRFKPSGKYYDTVSFGTNSEFMYQISDEVKRAVETGLISDYYDYFFDGSLFDGGEHPNAYPVLIKTAHEVLNEQLSVE